MNIFEIISLRAVGISEVGIAVFLGCLIIIFVLQVLLLHNTKPSSKIIPFGDRNMIEILRNPEAYLNSRGVSFLRWQKKVLWVAAFGWILLMSEFLI